jgi:hypothetical protein
LGKTIALIYACRFKAKIVFGRARRIIPPPITSQTTRTISTMVGALIPPLPLVTAAISVITAAATEKQDQQDDQK